jgi:splicing factor U2AF subunit
LFQLPTHTPRTYEIPGIVSLHVENGPGKIFLGNLPPALGEEELKELASQFGPLKAFNLVRDLSTGISKGYAFMSYINADVTELACSSLNGMSSAASAPAASTAAWAP